MTIQGYFKDIHNNTIDVLIYKAGNNTNYSIGDELDSTHHFCFNGDSPVTITRECDDLFEPIISTTCTIKLLSNIWCGDILFSSGIGDIIVRVKRVVNEVDELMFVGYVTPLTFSQDINMRNNVIDIQCKDVLGYLGDRTLSTGSSYDSVLANASYKTFANILSRLGIFNTSTSSFVFPNEQYSTQLYMDTVVETYKDLEISDNLWLGSSKDSEMTLSDILLEILKYTNSRIISVDGITHYLISNNANTTTNTFYYANTGNEVTFSNTSTTLPQDDKSDEQVTIDDCYNVIGVKCDLETIDDVVVSPLKEENYDKPYVNKQVYMTEYACEYDDMEKGNKYYINWMGMLQNNYPSTQANITDYSGLWMRNWYVRYCTAKNWQLYNEFVPPTTTDGKLIRQYESIGRMNDLYNNPLISMTGLIDSMDCNLYPAFLEIGHSANKMTAINPEEGEVEMKPHLFIPCPETWMYYSDGWAPITEEHAYNYINAQLAKYETTPMAKYTSSTIANFTPADDTITNYIVFSGKMKLIPSCVFEEQPVPNMGYSYRGVSCPDSYQQWVYHRYVNPYTNSIAWQVEPAIGSAKDKQRWYYRVYWTKENPNQERQYRVHDPNEGDVSSLNQQWRDRCAQESGSPTYRRGILYSLDTDGMYSKMFGWGNTVLDSRNTTIINLRYVPILMCRLRVGDKWLNEIQTEGQELPTWEWSTDPNSVFSLGVKPKRPNNLGDEPTDFLIGQEFEIYNNITDSMNIQGTSTGMAVPIRFSDKLRGDVEFQIIGPYNAVLTSTNYYYRHSTWFRSEKSWSEQNAAVSVLNHTHAIDITDFEVKTYTDNAKNATSNEGDLLYYSEDNKKYNNPKDDIEFKIVSALTPSEAAELNVSTGVSFNNPTTLTGDIYTPEVKPEEIYIQTMYDLYSTPKKIVEYESTYGDNKIADIYRTVYSCNLMNSLDVQNFNTIVIGDEIDLKYDRIKIKTREL